MMFWFLIIAWPLSLLFVGIHALKFGMACGVQYMKDDLKDVGIELVNVGGIKLFKPLYGPHWYEHRLEQAQENAQETVLCDAGVQ